MLDLRPIKYRLSTATPGPWSLDVACFQPKSIWWRLGKLFSADDATFADCDLIAHAPTDLAALVAEVERLRGQFSEKGVEICGLEKGVINLESKVEDLKGAIIALRNNLGVKVAAAPRKLQERQDEVERLRAAIEAHRRETEWVAGEADQRLWAVLDA